MAHSLSTEAINVADGLVEYAEETGVEFDEVLEEFEELNADDRSAVRVWLRDTYSSLRQEIQPSQEIGQTLSRYRYLIDRLDTERT